MTIEKVKTAPCAGDKTQAWVLVNDGFTRAWVRASEVLGEPAENGIFDRVSDTLDYANKAMRQKK
jgi:hypothetical protein